MGVVHLLREHATDSSRVRQRPQQHVGGPAPGGVPPFEPVPLDLLTSRVVDLDGVAALHAAASLAVRAKSGEADLACKGGIALHIAETLHFVMKGRGPDVRIVGEARRQIVGERFERIGTRARTDAWCPRPVQIGADRLAVAVETRS